MGQKVLKKNAGSEKINLIFEELEHRLLLSADALAVVAESSIATTQELVLEDNDANTLIVQNYAEQSSAVIQEKDHGSELVIIDSRAPNFQQLHNDIINAQQQGRDIQVVVLDAHRDGIEQISEALTRYNNLDAVHIVSHGNTGKLHLGTTQLDKQQLKERTEEIRQWSESFTQAGDLLLYGCNLAGTANGQSLVDALAKHTGTDVAASDDLTGNNILGGDWDLEYKTGDIETDIAFTQDVQDNWQGVLNTNAASASSEQTQETALVEELAAEEPVITEEQPVVTTQTDPAALTSESGSDPAAIVTQTQIDRRQEIIFVDQSVAEYQTFLDEIQLSDETTDYQVVLLDSTSDGIEQISQVLNDYQELDAVHIISHGTDGQIFLGSTPLIASTLSENSEQISAWGDAFSEDGDLLLYGCNLAETEIGQALINSLSNLTGTDVAASDDSTGHASLGADWDLEYETGIIETSIVVNNELQQSWIHEMAVYTYLDQFTADATWNQTAGSQDWSGSSWIALDSTGASITGGEFLSVRSGGSSLSDYYRITDLTGASSATFSFDVNATGSSFTSSDNFVAYVSSDGGASWTVLETVTGDVAGGSYSYDISSYIAPNTAIRLGIYHSSSPIGSDWITLDNVQISYIINGSAPVLYNTGDMTLTNVTEDDTDPTGDTVASIIATSAANGGDAITDADADPEGIAVIGTTNTNGSWQYSIDSGSSWTAFGNLTAGNDLATLLDANDMIRFVPNADYNGTAGDITFHAWDNTSGNSGDTAVDVSSNGGTTAYSTATETATLTVTAVNDAPVVDSATFSVAENSANSTVVGSVVANDVDVADTLTYSITAGDVGGVFTINASSGEISVADGTQLNFEGTASYSLTVQAMDDGTGTLVGSNTITVNVSNINEAPVTVNDTFTVDEGSTSTINLAGNDSDVDDGLDLTSISITSDPSNGSIIVNTDGTVDYTHDGSETINDSFDYTISDITGAISNTATVSLSVNAINDNPVAFNDIATVNEGAAVVIDLAVNDTDLDNAIDLNSISIIAAPLYGDLIIHGDGTVTYTHDGSETLSDSFSYTISDISGAISNTASVNLNVIAINEAPTMIGVSNVNVDEDSINSVIDLNVVFDDVDNPDTELTYTVVGNTNIGLFASADINASTGELTLDYAMDMNGSSQISIRATDLAGASVDTLFTVTVSPVDDIPVLDTNSGTVVTDTSEILIDNNMLSASDVDNTATEIQYIVTALPTSGTLLLNGVALVLGDTFTEDDVVNNRISYQVVTSPTANDQFIFTVTDGSNTLTDKVFNITILLTIPAEIEEPEEIIEVIETDVPEIQDDVVEIVLPVVVGDSEVVDGFESGFVPIASSGSDASQQQQPSPSFTDEYFEDNANEIFENNQLSAVDNLLTNFDLESTDSLSEIQVKSIKALWVAVDKMKQQIDESTAEEVSNIEFRAATVSSSGVALTAGVVAWVLRSGALMTSLMSTIPIWKGYDPLPVLAYRDDEEEDEEVSEDKIPTSLEELRKIKKIKESMKPSIRIDSLFGNA